MIFKSIGKVSYFEIIPHSQLLWIAGIQRQRTFLLHGWLRYQQVKLDAVRESSLLVRVTEPDSLPVQGNLQLQ